MKPNIGKSIASRFKVPMKLNLTGRRKWFVAGAAGIAAATAIATTVAVAPATHASAANTPSASAAAAANAKNAAKSAAAQPKLTTDTPAKCNAKPAPGHFQCFAVMRTAANHVVPQLDAPPAGALGPADIQSAYNLPTNAGGGQTIADVIWGDDATLESDLAVFRAQYGLPPCTTANGCFRKVNQEGQQSNYPTDQGTGVETSLDIDAYSSACPSCNILVVEADSGDTDALGAAEDEAVTLGAKFISNSYGTGDGEAEDPSYNDLDQYYDHPGVAVTASAGDGGWGVSFPASDPNLVSVGGTQLTKDSSVARGWDETVWGNGTEGAHGDGTGSGCSEYQPQATWQGGIAALTAVCPANRGVADISADASPESGLAIYDSNPNDSSQIQGWGQVGGTSLAAPLVAAMYALAGSPAPDTYPVSYPYQGTADLNDITSGTNGDCGNVLCNAAAGWDGPTGLGTPNGVQALVGAPQGTVSGQVTDSVTGQPVAGARVTVSPGSGGVTADANGNYTLTGLASGTYSLTATAADYHAATQTGVQVTAGQTVTSNFSLVPQGSIAGQVTDAATGDPIAGVSVTASPGDTTVTTDASGDYTVKGLDPGSYSVTATKFTYADTTVSGISVADATVTTENLTLTQSAISTVTGTVTDGSGQGWPLYAKITVDGDPNGSIFTDSVTGKYSVTLPQGTQSFQVTPQYPGYQPLTKTVQVNQADQTVNFAPQIDTTSCTAPGYGPDGLNTDFLGWTGDTAQNGWTATGGRSGWRFDDPGNRMNPPGSDDNFAIADALYNNNRSVSTTLTSPTANVSGQANPMISFDTHYIGAAGESGSVQVSTDNGRHWSTLWHQTNGFVSTEEATAQGYVYPPIQLPVPSGTRQVRVRFSYSGHGGGYWELDNVLIGSPTCVPQAGGLIVGNATDAGTGTDLPGVTIARSTDLAHPAITAATPDDPSTGDGLYWLFVPAGLNQLTASDEGYATARQFVSVKSGQVVRQDFALKAAS